MSIDEDKPTLMSNIEKKKQNMIDESMKVTSNKIEQPTDMLSIDV
jgi:hypothetical protein